MKRKKRPSIELQNTITAFVLQTPWCISPTCTEHPVESAHQIWHLNVLCLRCQTLHERLSQTLSIEWRTSQVFMWNSPKTCSNLPPGHADPWWPEHHLPCSTWNGPFATCHLASNECWIPYEIHRVKSYTRLWDASPLKSLARKCVNFHDKNILRILEVFWYPCLLRTRNEIH